MSILLQGGILVTSHGRRQGDIRIEGEKISKIGTNLPVADSQVEDVSGRYLLPGFIDAHTHLELNNGPGSQGSADNFYTEARQLLLKAPRLSLIWRHLQKDNR